MDNDTSDKFLEKTTAIKLIEKRLNFVQKQSH